MYYIEEDDEEERTMPRLERHDRRSSMIWSLLGIGFGQTLSAPASKNCVPMSFPEQPTFPEQPMRTDSIRIRRMVKTTSVPTMTPPADSMYWSTIMTSNFSVAQMSRASSPVAASRILALGATPLTI